MFLALFDFSASNLKKISRDAILLTPFSRSLSSSVKWIPIISVQSFPGKKWYLAVSQFTPSRSKITCSRMHHKLLDFVSSTSFTNDKYCCNKHWDSSCHKSIDTFTPKDIPDKETENACSKNLWNDNEKIKNTHICSHFSWRKRSCKNCIWHCKNTARQDRYQAWKLLTFQVYGKEWWILTLIHRQSGSRSELYACWWALQGQEAKKRLTQQIHYKQQIEFLPSLLPDCKVHLWDPLSRKYDCYSRRRINPHWKSANHEKNWTMASWPIVLGIL